MAQENIQRRENQAIREVFDRAGDLKKVMIVGLDYAEEQHRVAICNGQGDLLSKSTWVRNDREGLAFLEARVKTLCGKRAIDRRHVVFGGETPGSWAVNFVHNLRVNGNLVVDLHAQDVKRQRENATTDNDSLAALTICRCLINKMGREHLHTGVYAELRLASRFQAKLSKELTRVQNRMHSSVDVYFPGLLDSERSGVPAFSRACFWVLQRCSVARVRRMKPERLAQQLHKQGLRKAEQAASKLKDLAELALVCSDEMQRSNRLRLQCLISQYRLLRQQEEQAANEAARLLRQTPGALLTSVDGIGVKFAFQLTAELGDPEQLESVDKKVNYFGLTEKSHQTGGQDKPKKKRGRQRKCNRFGKKAILAISDSVARWGPPEYREYYMQRRLAGKNGRYGLARRLLRFAIGVLQRPHVYAPPHVRGEPDDSPFWRIQLRILGERMHEKWRAYSERPSPEYDVLKQWEETVKAYYKVDINI